MHVPTLVAMEEQGDDPSLDDCLTSVNCMEASVSLLSTFTNPLEANEDVHISTSLVPEFAETESLLHEQSSVFGQDVNRDIVVSILRAFEILEEINGSQNSFLNVLKFGRDLYCKNNQSLLRRWPTTWSACMNILKEAGYKEPTTYYVCLDESHPNLWNLMHNPHDVCKHCRKAGTIQYYYLSLMDKVKRWCSSKEFCAKMTHHWKHKENWLYGSRENDDIIYKEFWDGTRFAELKWFWDPQEEWMLPTYCATCNEIINADLIKSTQRMQSEGSQLIIECPYCYSQFNHTPRFAKGDPRNIALLGHWDGFQPFNTSPKHSCGMIYIVYS